MNIGKLMVAILSKDYPTAVKVVLQGWLGTAKGQAAFDRLMFGLYPVGPNTP